MGLAGLSWQEILAWQSCSGLELTTWELSVIKRLSDAYANQMHRAKEANCKQPYSPIIEEESIDREAVANKISSVLSMFKRK